MIKIHNKLLYHHIIFCLHLPNQCLFISSEDEIALADKESFYLISDYLNPVYTSKESLGLMLTEPESPC